MRSSIRRMCICLFFLAVGCRAPTTDWNGNWKLSLSESNYQGPRFTITTSSNADYGYNDGKAQFTLHCDGKHRFIGVNRTQTCVTTGSGELDLVQTDNAVKTKVNHWALSADSKVFTATATTFGKSGAVVDMRIVASRVSGLNGFAGEWQDTSFLERHSEMKILVENKILHLDFPGAGQYVNAPLGGAAGTEYGPHAPNGVTYQARLAAKREILTQVVRDHDIVTRGSLELSGDGKVIVYSWWAPGQVNNKGRLIYRKK